jgi:hypothetical protein
MPIQLGGPSLPKPKKPKNPKVLDPFGVPHVGAQTLPALGGAQPMGISTPQVTIPNANSIVGAGTGSASVGDPYRNELANDPTWLLADKNYQDALTMGERTMLSDPINRLIQQYGYDPRTTAGSRSPRSTSIPWGSTRRGRAATRPRNRSSAASARRSPECRPTSA